MEYYMKKERILSHIKSKKLNLDEIADVSAAGTSVATANGTYTPQTGVDVNADVNIDL